MAFPSWPSRRVRCRRCSGRITRPVASVPAYDTSAMADAIAGLLDDPSCALRMGIAGRQRVVERFSWDRAAAETVEVYREAGAC